MKNGDWVAAASVFVAILSIVSSALVALRAQEASAASAKRESHRLNSDKAAKLAASLAPIIAMLHDLDPDRLADWTVDLPNPVEEARLSWVEDRVSLFELWSADPAHEIRIKARQAVEDCERCLALGRQVLSEELDGVAPISSSHELREARIEAFDAIESLASLLLVSDGSNGNILTLA